MLVGGDNGHGIIEKVDWTVKSVEEAKEKFAKGVDKLIAGEGNLNVFESGEAGWFTAGFIGKLLLFLFYSLGQSAVGWFGLFTTEERNETLVRGLDGWVRAVRADENDEQTMRCLWRLYLNYKSNDIKELEWMFCFIPITERLQESYANRAVIQIHTSMHHNTPMLEYSVTRHCWTG